MEIDNSNQHAFISYRAVVAGILIAFFVMAGLVGVGLAFGGMGLSDGSSAKSAGIFTGTWFIVSAFLSIFAGSYFAARVSRFRTSRVGAVQGLVIASLFIGLILYQTIAAIGSAGSLMGNAMGKMGNRIASLSDNEAVQRSVRNVAEDSIGNLNLRSSPQVVARSVVSRLVQGDTEGAKNYLAREARITPEEADRRIVLVRSRLDNAMEEVRIGAASALRSTGISLFLLVVLGALAAVGGGAWGSSANFRKPYLRDESIRNAHPTY